MGERRSFEFGLIMAGAISAGAYTAGVVDFLIEALDAYEAAKRQPGHSGPTHDIRLPVMTGASAGAMTSAIAAVSLHAETEPVHDVDNPPPAEHNRLYDSWVRRVGIAAMLGDEDIRREGRLLSALDSSDLDRIAMEALSVPRRPDPRAWVADPLAVYLTVANLRGVPYGFRLFGSGGGAQYGMTVHQDHMRFSVSPQHHALPAAILLDPAQSPGGDWPRLARAALASGAFPIGLRSRPLERPWSDYRERMARPPLAVDPAPETYRFLCVDGGLIDNEPLELARRHLAGNGRNPREGTRANRAVVMIDPFPNAAALAAENVENDGIAAVAGAMFGALINQARFKPEELALAESDDNYSRFMISPTRGDANGARIEPAMASATLGGFGGFLSEDFRKHDFQLGRRNCQRFFARHFTLPETNPLFDGWTGPRDAWYMRNADGSLETYTESDPTPMLPILPLVEAVRAEVPRYRAPSAASVDLDLLEKRITARANAVGRTLIDVELRDFLGSSLLRWTARQMFGWRVAPRIAAKARARVGEELRALR